MRAIAAEKEAQVDDLEGNDEGSHHSHHHHEGEFQIVVCADVKEHVH
jgi:hypothetical protein